MESQIKYIYRYVDGYTDGLSAYVYCEQFAVIKETAKSYIIRYPDRRKLVPKVGRNLFAFDTKEKAIFNYQKRKEKQIAILKARLNNARLYLEAAKSGVGSSSDIYNFKRPLINTL